MLSAQDIKDKLNIDDICAVIESLGGTYKGKDNNSSTLYYSSISHNLYADDGTHKSRLNVHVDDLTMTDYVLGYTFDIFELVKLRKQLQGVKYNFPQCIKYVCDVLNIDYNVGNLNESKNIYDWSKLKKYLNLKRNNKEIELKEYDPSILKCFDKIYYQSWLDEGFTKEILDKWGIKWYNYQQQIVIPIYDNSGILRGIRVRNTVPNNIEEFGKYNPLRLLDGKQFNFPSSQILYGENYHWENIKNRKSVVLVESEKSVIKSDMWDDKSVTLALFGHILSDYNLKRLIDIGVNELTISIDYDYEKVYNDDNETFTDKYEEYCKNINRIFDKCSQYFKVYYLKYPNNHNKFVKWSPYDFDKDKFGWLWEHRERL